MFDEDALESIQHILGCRPVRLKQEQTPKGWAVRIFIPEQQEKTFSWFLGNRLPDREQAVRLFQEHVPLIEPQRQLDPTDESERLDARATLFPDDPGAVKGGLTLLETPGLYDGRISRALARSLSRRTVDMPQFESWLDWGQLVV